MKTVNKLTRRQVEVVRMALRALSTAATTAAAEASGQRVGGFSFSNMPGIAAATIERFRRDAAEAEETCLMFDELLGRGAEAVLVPLNEISGFLKPVNTHPDPTNPQNAPLLERIQLDCVPCIDSFDAAEMSPLDAYFSGVNAASSSAVNLMVEPVRYVIGRPHSEEAKERRRVSRRVLRDLVGYSKEQLAGEADE